MYGSSAVITAPATGHAASWVHPLLPGQFLPVQGTAPVSPSDRMYSRKDGTDPGRSRAGTSSASSGIWGRLSCAGWVVRVRVLRRALAPGDLKRLQRFQEFVRVHVHLGTGVDNVVTDNVPSPWVRVKVYRPLDPGVPLTFRRLRVRYKKRGDIHEAFQSLGCALICWRFLRVDRVAG